MRKRRLDAATWPDDILSAVRNAVSSQPPAPKKPKFQFELTKEAAAKNLCVLSKYKLDLSAALEAQRDSPLGYGSEFRTVNVLSNIYGMHPVWPRMQSILLNGSSWPLEPLDNASRLKDVEEALLFGNHNGASNNPELLKQLVGKDVKYGYAFPIPLNAVTRVPGLLMAPMNIAPQNTIDETGKIISKDRLTHNQSYKWKSSGTSVNSRIRKHELLPCMFGHAIRRIINWIVTARLRFPNRKIFVGKFDFKSAFRRCHLNAETAIQTCTQIPEEKLAIIALRLTFGGTPGPYEWGAISEPICDLVNAL